jgi:hypothetical protein
LSECNFTAFGLTTINSQFLNNINFLFTDNQHLLPINHRCILLSADITTPVYRTLKQIMKQHPRFYNNSLCDQFNVHSVPITSRTLEQLHLDHENDTASVNGLEDFYGVDILPFNVGSTDGLVNSVTWILDHTSRDRYTLVHADVNIYLRYYRVCSTFV